MNHADLNHGFARLWVAFVVFAVAATAADPGKRTLDDPALRDHLETNGNSGTRDNLDGEAQRIANKFRQAVSFVGRVGEDQFDPFHLLPQSVDHQAGSAVVLLVGSMNHDRQHKPQRIDDQVTFPSR